MTICELCSRTCKARKRFAYHKTKLIALGVKAYMFKFVNLINLVHLFVPEKAGHSEF